MIRRNTELVEVCHYLSSVWAGLFSLTLSGEAVAEAFRLPLHAQQQGRQRALTSAVATRSTHRTWLLGSVEQYGSIYCLAWVQSTTNVLKVCNNGSTAYVDALCMQHLITHVWLNALARRVATLMQQQFW